jgi:BirA family biotin operon repressor/biotin-[acetyl-CoA-carboxylase] ligase
LAGLAPAWTTVEVYAEAASTNAVVSARAGEGAPEGLVVVADHQTAGRGRLDRSWVTPPGAALTFSVLLRPQVADHRWPWLPLLAGVAVVEAVEDAGGPPCVLKWPNDLLYDGRKLAGLLVERVETPTGPAAVLGIGLNVSTTDEELPVAGAASLAGVGWPGLDRALLLVQLLDSLGRRLRRWGRDDGDPQGGLMEAYLARCETVGRQVRVHLPSGSQLVGTAVGIAENGGLVVDHGSGQVTVSAGDVVHVRPA